MNLSPESPSDADINLSSWKGGRSARCASRGALMRSRLAGPSRPPRRPPARLPAAHTRGFARSPAAPPWPWGASLCGTCASPVGEHVVATQSPWEVGLSLQCPRRLRCGGAAERSGGSSQRGGGGGAGAALFRSWPQGLKLRFPRPDPRFAPVATLPRLLAPQQRLLCVPGNKPWSLSSGQRAA